MTTTGDRVASPAWVGLRTLLTLHALFVFAQPVLAGRFLSGDYRMLGVHGANASIVGILGYTQLVMAFLYWRPAGGVAWPVAVSLGLSAAETVQIVLGYAHVVAVHVPLGVLIVTVNVLMAVWAWRPGFGRRRTVARRSAA